MTLVRILLLILAAGCAHYDAQGNYAALLLAGRTSATTTSTVVSGYLVNAVVAGLVTPGGALVLQNNSGDDLSISSNGTTAFATTLANAASYNVTVLTQPTAPVHNCVVSSGSGTISSADVNITVTCTPSFKYIFESNSLFDGNRGGSAGADASCNSDGTKPNGSTYKALLADAARTACTTANCSGGTGEHTNWILAANTLYRRADGTTNIFVTNSNGIFSFGTMMNTFTSTGSAYWTGLRTDWRTAVKTCSNWTNSSGNPNQGTTGLATSTSGTALDDAGNPACSTAAKLLCVEQ